MGNSHNYHKTVTWINIPITFWWSFNKLRVFHSGSSLERNIPTQTQPPDLRTNTSQRRAGFMSTVSSWPGFKPHEAHQEQTWQLRLRYNISVALLRTLTITHLLIHALTRTQPSMRGTLGTVLEMGTSSACVTPHQIKKKKSVLTPMYCLQSAKAEHLPHTAAIGQRRGLCF